MALLEIDVFSELVKRGTNFEDGSDDLAKIWYVRATATTGRRWIHVHSFAQVRNCRAEGCFEGDREAESFDCSKPAAQTYPSDAKAHEAADKLCARVRAAQQCSWRLYSRNPN